MRASFKKKKKCDPSSINKSGNVNRPGILNMLHN